jgi:hypothetical protein
LGRGTAGGREAHAVDRIGARVDSEGDPIDGMVIASEEAAALGLYSLEDITFRAGS